MFKSFWKSFKWFLMGLEYLFGNVWMFLKDYCWKLLGYDFGYEEMNIVCI